MLNYPTSPSAIQKDLRDLVRDLSLTIHEGEKLPLLEKKEMESLLASGPHVPKILTKLSDHRRRNHHFLSLLCHIPQSLPEALKEKP